MPVQVPNGVAASVHRSVHVLVPVGEVWTFQLAMPEPPVLSAAAPLKVTLPERFVPTVVVSVAVTGFVLSMRRLVTVAEVVVRPTLSVTMARKS